MNDCLLYTLFHPKNAIQTKFGANHWIPFTAQEVNAKDNFQSHFMSDFLKDKALSPEAQAVLDAGRELWRYYHASIVNDPTASVNASFYDIKEFFKGRTAKGIMKSKSDDAAFNNLMEILNQNLDALAEKIQPKVYKYGFLLK
jgi:hypothetical protein